MGAWWRWSARSDREIWWIYGARNRAEHPFRAESKRLIASLPRARRLIAYSAPGAADAGFDVAARLSWTELERAGVPTDADFYICGPPAQGWAAVWPRVRHLSN